MSPFTRSNRLATPVNNKKQPSKYTFMVILTGLLAAGVATAVYITKK